MHKVSCFLSFAISSELKEKCLKKGLNFEVENKKILDKREAKRVKAEKKAAKKNK